MSDIKWQRGKFIKFFAKMKIRVGGQNSIDIMSGDEFEYDGSILKYSGMEVSQPQLRGAVESGWASLSPDDYDDSPVPTRPSRNVAKSQTVNKDLNRVQRASAMSTSSMDEDEVLRISDRSAPTKNASPPILNQDNNRRRMEVRSSDTDDQGAVSIGRVRTSAKAVFSDVTTAASAKKLAEIENMSNVKAELYGRDGTITREGVSVKTNVSSVRNTGATQDDDGVSVGSVRKTASVGTDGISVSDTSNIRNSKLSSKTDLKSKSSSKNSSKPVISPKKSAVEKITDPRIRVARVLDPDFPSSWVFTGKLADRLQAVKDHGITPQFLQALFAAEGDQMRKVLVKEFPDQFGG